MAARTQRIFRQESFFELLADGGAEFDSLAKPDLGGFYSGFLSALFGALAGVSGYIALQSGNEPLGWGLVLSAAFFALFILSKIRRGIGGLWDRRFHRPTPVVLAGDGLAQASHDGTLIELKWEDIRVVQHRRSAHMVRGRDKKDQVEISKRLQDHQELSAFIKFAFLLRQEASGDWVGFLDEVRSRLSGSGFHFHYDSKRKHMVHIDAKGISHLSPKGGDEQMDWDLMKESIFDQSKSMLRFKHPGTQTILTIPRGTDGDQVIEHFIRWALHTDPSFS